MRQKTFILVAVLLVLALLGSISCKGKFFGRSRPKDPGIYVDAGKGRQKVDESKVAAGYVVTPEELSNLAFTIRRGTTKVKLEYVMAPSEAADPSTFFVTNMSDATLYTLVPTDGGLSVGMNSTMVAAKELTSSAPKEGYQCFEFTLPTTASTFVISTFRGRIFLKF